MIEIIDLKKSFGSQLVLDKVSLRIEHGETLAIVGPSGTGKSVLLKIIVGLLEADEGDVIVDGKSIVRARTDSARREITGRMGVLFQNAALFDSMNLFENVIFPLRRRSTLSEKEMALRAIKYLDEVGLGGYELALPGEISIGMRKRVGIARALITEPDVLLFDEPNTGLDPEMGQEIYDLIRETQKNRGFTGIVVSHEIPEVFQVCHRVVMLFGGHVQFDGTPEQFLSSGLEVVMQFCAGSTEGPIQMLW